MWVYLLKHKDEVFDRFLECKAMVEKASGQKLKILRTDNGGEYTSNKFEEFLKSEGICHECTVPKTPEQNGVAERLNRTLAETVRAMLIDSKLPQKFWAEALLTAVYLKNQSPTKALEGMTPYEAWTKEKPHVEHLRVTHMIMSQRMRDKNLTQKQRNAFFWGTDRKQKAIAFIKVKCFTVVM